MKPLRASLATGLLLPVLLTACASGGAPKPLTQGLEGERHATIEVRNGHNHEVDVSVVRSDGGFPSRVGSVDPSASRGYRLPQTMNGEPVRILVVCRVTREVHESHEVVWQPTQRIALTIGAYLPLTKLAIR